MGLWPLGFLGEVSGVASGDGIAGGEVIGGEVSGVEFVEVEIKAICKAERELRQRVREREERRYFSHYLAF